MACAWSSDIIMRTQSNSRAQLRAAWLMQPLVMRTIVSLLPKQQRMFLMSNSNQNNANRNLSQPQDGREQLDAAVVSTSSLASGIQAIATAHGDYNKKSFEDMRSYVDKLSGV